MLRWREDARTTAGFGTRTASSRAARCSRRSRSAPDICIPRALRALLRALLQLPLHVGRHLVRLRLAPPTHRYVTRAVHAVQNQLVQRQPARSPRVDRLRPTRLPSLPRRTATSPRTESARNAPSRARSEAGARS